MKRKTGLLTIYSRQSVVGYIPVSEMLKFNIRRAVKTVKFSVPEEPNLVQVEFSLREKNALGWGKVNEGVSGVTFSLTRIFKKLNYSPQHLDKLEIYQEARRMVKRKETSWSEMEKRNKVLPTTMSKFRQWVSS